MRNPWKKISSKTVYKNPWFSVEQHKVVRPDGSNGEYNFISMPPAVFVVAMNEKDEVALIGQYRYPTSEYSRELPAGGAEEKNLLSAAKRELQEETGCTAKKWKQLGCYYTSNGTMDQLMYAFLATDLRQTKNDEKLEEGIQEVLWVSWKKLLNMTKKGEMRDGQSMSALLLAAIELKKI